MAEQICQHVSGFPNWLITKHQQSYLEAFESCTKDLVYLTAGMPSSYSVHILLLPGQDFSTPQHSEVSTKGRITFASRER